VWNEERKDDARDAGAEQISRAVLPRAYRQRTAPVVDAIRQIDVQVDDRRRHLGRRRPR